MAEGNADRHAARRALMRRVFGSRITQVVGLAARLDLADAIGDGERDAAELGRDHGIAPEQMTRLLRALASLGLCVERAPGSFALTDAGALLRSDHPESLRDFTRFHTAPQTLQPWDLLEHTLRTGRTAFDEQFGMPLYAYLAGEPEFTEVFNAAMSQESRETAATVTAHYDFGRYRSVTDVGGGDGTLITAILREHPGLRGVVFETPEGAAQASKTLAAAGLQDRCTVATGDFFEAVPEGSDLYVIKSVIHNWDDERAAAILGSCRRAMSGNSRVLIVDVVLPDVVPPTTPGQSEERAVGLDPYVKDLQMAVLVGGRERTRSDVDRLCARAGLKVTGVVPLPASVGFSLVEAAAA
ncbi:methyltransferase [Streptomyces sp. TRM70308]|uniref:methyltransferase n=1 Tax=Streptomyces sp. TRM70308 TaxID=3131932 RepID=UPI003CFD2A8D